MERWYVVYTKPQKEVVAEEHLKHQNFQTCLPLLKEPRRIRRKWQDVVLPLFPRYLFVKLKLGQDNIAPIRSTRGVVKLVHFGKNPVPLPYGFVEELESLVESSTGYYTAIPSRPLFAKGDLIKIMEGPFAGLTGTYQMQSGDRALVLMELLGRQNHIEIEYHQISPV